ncbi:PREDICTED: erythroblast NAD(P)(+)--arginine ADP-ribosyltransferase-like [Calidris pugnax]|uniref:erythroblast NAD(P)(+)--arginine ADP-ribosyltransferase-like n=1 Tax=Calidris pugnax TaxID=198806 RepID=UPI00071E1B6E|nr:PREDICTED: erythroblast NAD(P)(+)--arginine ADP-ribosyltransferase-like [Calidris pugnax]
MSMENLVLALVLLAGALAIRNPLQWQDLGPNTEIKLDEARNSFDDQYQGCIPKMNQELEKIMTTEFARNPVFKNTWAKAVEAWKGKGSPVPKTPPLQKEHVIALIAYSMHEPLYSEFNTAVREGGRSHKEYMEKFQFKAMHFLLTQAVTILQNTGGSFIPTNCHQVYRGIRKIHFTAQRQDLIRFGQFASSSLRKDKAEQFGTDTFFSVYTCYGALIRNFSLFPTEEEVLIPPFETFQVTNITKNGKSTYIQLKSKGRFSTYNCEWLKEKRCKDQPWDFSAEIGQFASSSLRKDKAEQFGTDTFFSVYTCYGALIRNFSLFPTEEEVLIPPFETFQVTNITKNGKSTHIQLKSKGRFSTYNCEWLKVMGVAVGFGVMQ